MGSSSKPGITLRFCIPALKKKFACKTVRFFLRFQIRMAFANLILRFTRPRSFSHHDWTCEIRSPICNKLLFPKWYRQKLRRWKMPGWWSNTYTLPDQEQNPQRVLGRSRSFSTISNTIRNNVLLSDNVD